MAVYVDEIRYYETSSIKGFAKRYGNHWCHLFADTLEELHEFAKRIGCRRGWFQDHNPRFPHYDLTEARRDKALAAGATPVQLRQWIRERKTA